MGNNLPRKIFHAPTLNNPIPGIYKGINDANEKYPLSALSNADGWLPDFTRAVEMKQCVYRINVPGYFYKCPGTTGTSDNSSKSGLIIAAYNYKMNSVQSHLHDVLAIEKTQIYSKTTQADETVKYAKNGIKYCATVSGTHVFTKVDSSYVEYKETYVDADYAHYLDGWKLESATSSGQTCSEFTAQIEKNSDGDIADGYAHPPSSTLYPPTTPVGGTNCRVAILFGQRECPEYFPNYPSGSSTDLFCRDYGLNYFVCTGDNSSGGIANSLIPIIPGLATTTKPSGIKYGNPTKCDTSCVFCSSTSEDNPTWGLDALSETMPTLIASLLKISKYYCPWMKNAQNETSISGYYHSTAYLASDNTKVWGTGIFSPGVLEAKGTYVYYYREKSCKDKFFFVPAKSSTNEVKPITKIRDITTPSSCTYNLPSKIRIIPREINGPAFAHANGSSKYSEASQNGIGAVFTTSTKIFDAAQSSEIDEDDYIKGDSGYTSRDADDGILSCENSIHPHSGPFDSTFRDIFKNSSIDGFSEKFVAQVLTLPTYPGTVTTNMDNGGKNHSVVTVFDPTTQGA